MKMLIPGYEFTLVSEITGRTYFGPSMQKLREAEYKDRHHLGSTVWPALLEVWDDLILPEPVKVETLMATLDLDAPAWMKSTVKVADLVGTDL